MGKSSKFVESFLMRSACRRTVEAIPTETTLVRSIVRVDVSMHLKGTQLAKRFSAIVASILPNVGVGKKVVFVGLAYFKRLIAQFAFKWSIVTVNISLVILQPGDVNERCWTLIAFVWIIASMTSHVHRKFSGPPKPFCAPFESAWKALLVRVDSFVHI